MFVTGGLGFVGSNLVGRLIGEGHTVIAFDNLSLGSLEFVKPFTGHRHFRFVRGELLELRELQEAIAGTDVVFHLAANSDITQSRAQTDLDLRQGTLVTFNVLEAMRRTGVSKIVFSSSSVVYGEPLVTPTPENYGPLHPISLYGASKLACEGLISAFCHNFDFQAWVFRFANICGRHGTHGVLVDFIHKLKRDSRRLEILGNGKQAKPYLHVSDCVDGILFGWQRSSAQLNCFNLGCSGATSVARIAQILLDAMMLEDVALVYSGGDRGWVGDVPQVRLDCTKFESLGWKPRMSSDEAVKLAALELLDGASCKL